VNQAAVSIRINIILQLWQISLSGLLRFKIWPLNLWIYFWTFGRTPWTGDRPVARPLPTQDSATQKTRTHIHASSGIRTQDPSVRAVENSTYLKQRGHWDRLSMQYLLLIMIISFNLFNCQEGPKWHTDVKVWTKRKSGAVFFNSEHTHFSDKFPVLFHIYLLQTHVMWVPVTTAWRALRLQEEETASRYGG